MTGLRSAALVSARAAGLAPGSLRARLLVTTLGFGDLSPAVGLPQALVAIEALVGQVFLVTMVARLVTLWVRRQDDAMARA